MSISRYQISKIIQENASQFAATAEEEAKRINDQTGAGYVTDQAFWENIGVVTGEDLAINVLNQTYSDLYKDIHGRRPRGHGMTTVDDLQAAIDDLDEYYEEIVLQDKLDVQRQQEYERERAELAALMPGEFDFQELPKQSGMGRRAEGTMRLTTQELMSVIREAVKNHVDGQPFPGTLEDLAKCHSKFWAHGAVVDPQGWASSVKLGGQFTKGRAPSILSNKKVKITERQLRKIIRLSLIYESGFSDIDIGAMEQATGRYAGPGGPPDPEDWAESVGLAVDYDEEGQKIIYLSNQEADSLEFPIDPTTGKPVEWDTQQNYDEESWTVYTGDYK